MGSDGKSNNKCKFHDTVPHGRSSVNNKSTHSVLSSQLMSGCSLLLFLFLSSVYHERKYVSGTPIELGATILFHLTNKPVNNNDFEQPSLTSHQYYHLGINPRLLMNLQSLEHSINARIIIGKKRILATEIAILNAIKQN